MRATNGPRALLRRPASFAFRLALLYGVVFTLSSAALIGFIAYATISSLEAQRDETIAAELAELQIHATAHGIEGVKHQAAARNAAVGKSQFIYTAYDAEDRLVMGVPLKVPRINGWSDVPSPTGDPDDATHIVHFKSALLPGGYLLAVGEDTDQVDDTREFILTSLLAGLAAAVALAVASALLLRWAFRRRLDRVAAVCQEIMAGNLALRLPMTAGDEIDVLAQSVNAMLDRIVALMGSLQQVTIDVAHDLRTPLARVRQGLETAELKATTTADYATAVRKAVGEIDTVLETFGALLKIAELEAGTLRSSFKSVDLSAVMRTVGDAYTPSAEENGQRIEVRIDNAIKVIGDEHLLTQLAANLIANALRHTPQGTSVTIGLSARDGHPTATIADNGPGIPSADRGRVFERFVRLERSRSTPGSGLGLSVCAAIAALHGVGITLRDNQPGLRVELSFPSTGG